MNIFLLYFFCIIIFTTADDELIVSNANDFKSDYYNTLQPGSPCARRTDDVFTISILRNTFHTRLRREKYYSDTSTPLSSTTRGV